MMRRNSVRALVAAATIAAGTIGLVSSPVEAGEPAPEAGVDVVVNVNGPNAPALAGSLVVEVYQDAGGSPGSEVDPLDCTVMPSATGPYSAQQEATCDLESGDYIIGLDGVPPNWTVTGSCVSPLQPPEEALDLGGAEAFSFFGFDNAECTLTVSASVLLIDKVVVGGDASSEDFTIQVLDGDTVIASGSDVADATCELDFSTANCGLIAMPSGTGFQIAEPTVEDYELTSVECDEFVNAEFPPDGGADVSDIGDDGFRTDDGDTYCVITNTYVPPATTTTEATTTTTMAPTTTVAPTTTIDAGVVTLPETGTSAAATGWLAMMAVGLITAGGAMLLARRRFS
jgi:LPXTG-motif cell wall-anchored protein